MVLIGTNSEDCLVFFKALRLVKLVKALEMLEIFMLRGWCAAKKEERENGVQLSCWRGVEEGRDNK